MLVPAGGGRRGSSALNVTLPIFAEHGRQISAQRRRLEARFEEQAMTSAERHVRRQVRQQTRAGINVKRDAARTRARAQAIKSRGQAAAMRAQTGYAAGSAYTDVLSCPGSACTQRSGTTPIPSSTIARGDVIALKRQTGTRSPGRRPLTLNRWLTAPDRPSRAPRVRWGASSP